MTITWTMVIGFSAAFAITTGSWNHSYAALRETKECVISIPTVDEYVDRNTVGGNRAKFEDTKFKYIQFATDLLARINKLD
jgi:flavin reductase (DIM6/NTAB) family NADH-FMN oxidoreductase RutF